MHCVLINWKNFKTTVMAGDVTYTGDGNILTMDANYTRAEL